MTDKHDHARRGFVKLCSSALVLLGAHRTVLAVGEAEPRSHERVRLVTEDGRPLRLSDLKPGESYVFHYPYAVTPSFLIDLGQPTARDLTLVTEDGKTYRWDGGIGPQHSVVAFSAICAHRMSHPAPSVSFIDYRHEEVTFRDSRKQTAQRSGVIFCCSEKSVYDPGTGCRVLGGPAKQPLAPIRLEQDPTSGDIYATASYGGEMYAKFFEKFGFRLALEHPDSKIREPVRDTSSVVPMAHYSQNRIRC
jgi:arsenite oxidase small subunit